jgi:hypothetical protein
MTLPLTYLSPWYPGQMGVPGSSVPRGVRSQSNGIVLFVDGGHPAANAFNDGTDPENPISTLTAAFARLAAFHALTGSRAEGTVICVAPGTYAESIALDRATYPNDCKIVGTGASKFDVIWQPASGDALSLDVGGWVVDGIHFQPSGTGAGVKLTWNVGAGAENTIIQNCFFDGRWGTGLMGVEFEGAPANCIIQGCRFAEFDAASPAITITATPTASPYQTHILNNTFQECAEYITIEAGGYNASVIAGNHFVRATGALAATTTFINLGTGSLGYNQVVGNFLDGDYSNAGGYTAETHALDNWVGNMAYDVAEAEVGDNGITVAVPAA